MKLFEILRNIYKMYNRSRLKNKDFSLININQINDEKMIDFNEFLPLFLNYLLAIHIHVDSLEHQCI